MRALFYLALTVVYTFPTIVAYLSRHPDRSRIARINIVAGWTLIAWIAAFNWSLHKPTDYDL